MTAVETILPAVSSLTKRKMKLYKRRWFILLIFSLVSFANACLYTGISAINSTAHKYWGVSPDIINWLPNSFVIIYIIIALPSAYLMTSLGLRVSMLLGASLNAISAALHFAGYQEDGFTFVMTGQIIAAFSVGAILQVPARLSTVWFPEYEHARATSFAMIMNIFGIAVGYIQSSQMVPSSDNMGEVRVGMFNMLLSQLIFLMVCLILVYLFFEEMPPTPPSVAAALTQGTEIQNLPFFASLKKLFSDKNYVLMINGYGLYFGMYSLFSVVLNEMVSSKLSQTKIGWMGFSSELAAILGLIICAQLIDKYQCYRLVSNMLVLGALVSWTVYTFLLLHTDSELSIFVSFCFVGFFGIPYFAVGVEQAAEMTYPVPEGTSSAIILIAGNLYGFVFILLLGSWIDHGNLSLVCYVTTGIYSLSFLFTAFIQVKLKRQVAELTHEGAINGGENQDLIN